MRPFSAALIAASVPLKEVLRFLIGRRAFLLIAFGSSLQSLSGYGVITWGPTFLARVHVMSMTQIGVSLGWISGLAGCVGRDAAVAHLRGGPCG